MTAADYKLLKTYGVLPILELSYCMHPLLLQCPTRSAGPTEWIVFLLVQRAKEWHARSDDGGKAIYIRASHL